MASAVYQHESPVGIHMSLRSLNLSPPTPPHPSVVTEHRVWAPCITQHVPTGCLCTRGSTHVSGCVCAIPYSMLVVHMCCLPIHPALCFPTVSTNLLCLCLLCRQETACRQAHQYHLPRFLIYALTYDICFSFWLASPCKKGSRFVYLRTYSAALLLIAEWYSVVRMQHNLCICFSGHGHLGCFHVRAL